MRANLRVRLVRVASDIQHLKNYRDLVEAMAELSDQLNASASEMVSAFEARDVEAVSKAILENRKTARQINYVLQRHERIVQNLESKA